MNTKLEDLAKLAGRDYAEGLRVSLLKVALMREALVKISNGEDVWSKTIATQVLVKINE